MSTEKHSIHIDVHEDRLPISRYLRVMGEAVLYFILVISPWVFGGVDPEWQYVIVCSTLLLTVLWLLRCVYYRRISIRTDGVTWGIGGLLCLTVLQVVPLPLSVVSLLSPNRAAQYTALVPEVIEQMHDENVQDRPGWITLSVDPYLTRHFLADLIICLAVYTVTRNWLATRGSIQRMSAIIAANAFALALFSLGQFFLANGKMYGLYLMPSSFGSFVCRNHYPFHAYLGLGLTLGLLFNKTRTEYSSAPSGKGIKGKSRSLVTWLNTVSQSPAAVLLMAAAIVIALSIPFSLSRGGILTLSVAGIFVLVIVTWTMGREIGATLILSGIFVLFTFALGAWLGWGPVERRIGNEFSNGVADNRSALWIASLKVFRTFPLFGCGANGFQRVEPCVRLPEVNGNEVMIVNDSVHNEYLEALCEGGVLRLAFTLVLVIAPIVSAVQAYRRLQSRSVGTLALGMAFGLFAVALHSVFDFGIHIPAIALLTVTVAAFARATSVDPDFQPKRRMKFSGKSESNVKEFDSESRTIPLTTKTVTGPPAIAVCIVIFIGMSLLVRQYRSWDLAERYSAASIALSKSNEPDRFEKRIALCTARVGYVPDDAEAYMALSRAYFDAFLDQHDFTVSEHVNDQTGEVNKDQKDVPEQDKGKDQNKVQGQKANPEKEREKNKSDANTSIQKLTITPQEREQFIVPGLLCAIRARAACPYFATAHMRLAIYRKQYAAKDESDVYFNRVKFLAPCDPEAWFASGVNLLQNKKYNLFVSDWKQSLKLSKRQLLPILELAKRERFINIVDTILPDNPAVILDAINKLYPIDDSNPEERQKYLEKILVIFGKLTAPNVEDFVTIAQVEYELGHLAESKKAWQMAVSKAPNDARIRQNYARWLEIEEQYDLLISELDWLRVHGQGGANIADRIDAAQHGLDLKMKIERP